MLGKREWAPPLLERAARTRAAACEATRRYVCQFGRNVGWVGSLVQDAYAHMHSRPMDDAVYEVTMPMCTRILDHTIEDVVYKVNARQFGYFVKTIPIHLLV